ncbi:hypothetical protein CG747_09945 [Streptomyces sp. CB02959]|nr:hypothetical protein CG747_09945 [Streptomyces sp. CB02959]
MDLPATERSDLVILDADNLPAPPIATAHLPAASRPAFTATGSIVRGRPVGYARSQIARAATVTVPRKVQPRLS